MTERLYYDNAYLMEFDAVVEKVSARDEKRIAALNRSAFYPTSGGQPFDTGTLNGARVTDVFVDADGEVWHEIDGELSVGDRVHGKIDWARRFDHMQQHGGEHMIAGAVYALTGGMTIGLHLGAEASSIDVEFADGTTYADDTLIRRIEDYVNVRIQQDHPVRCWFPDADELARLPLRKAPTVKEHVRIVAMGDFEMVACGGTHPSSTGQIGLVKIVSAAPARGKLRLTFVCGMRAYQDYRANYDAAWAAANALSTRPEKLAETVLSMQNRLKEAEHALNALRREKILSDAHGWVERAEPMENGNLLIMQHVDGDMAALKDAASAIIREPNRIVLLAAGTGEKCILLFARSDDVDIHMGKLLVDAVKPIGGKGGGRPDFAQGSGPIAALEAAKKML